MNPWVNLESLPCALLMVVGAVLLFLRLSDRAARMAWGTLLIIGMTHALGMCLLPGNLLNPNVVHYYLGAKYDFPYRSFYELTSAATDRPQIFMHDLDHPPGFTRDDPSEQRAYFIDLMRADGVSFDPLLPLADLQRLAEESGAVHREAERILAENLPADEIEDFRRDVRTALITENPDRLFEGIGNDITLDFGYNGSPFYTLIRRLDPTLYFPLGRATALLNLAWQIAGILASVWFVGLALGMTINQRLATVALVFASWDYVAWDLPGLSFAGFWLPVAIALWAISRNRPVLGGISIAWAGLIKLFPFALLFQPGVEALRTIWAKVRRTPKNVDWKFSLTVVGSALLFTLILGAISELSGRSWSDFIAKILPQFSSEGYVANNVSFGQVLLVLGIHQSPITPWLSVAALLGVGWLIFNSEQDGASRARLMLLVVAAMPWFTRLWFNYYAIAPLFLLPLTSQRHRLGASIGAASLALSFVLPAFDDPVLAENSLAWMAKVLPYIAIPAWLVFLEARPCLSSAKVRRWAVAAGVLASVVIGGEAIRHSQVRQYDSDGGRYLDQGNAEAALGCYNSLLGIAPGNAMAHMSRGICLAGLQRYNDAEVSFRRASELAPDQAHTFMNLARLLAMQGDYADARVEIEKAAALAPDDDAVWVVRALIADALGDGETASPMVRRAIELNPQNAEARSMLRTAR